MSAKTESGLRRRGAPPAPLLPSGASSETLNLSSSSAPALRDNTVTLRGSAGGGSTGALASSSSQEKSAPHLHSNTTSCRVLTYNLNLLPRGANYVGHGYKEERLKAFLDCIDVHSPECPSGYDILILQEVFATPILPLFAQGMLCRQKRLIAALAEKGFKYHAGSRPPTYWSMLSQGKWTDSGLLILSRFPIVVEGWHNFRTSGSSLDAGAAKGCIFAKVQLTPRDSLLLFNVHLQATHTNAGKKGVYSSIRSEQLNEVRQFIDRVTHQHLDSAFIVAGDFNINSMMTPKSAGPHGGMTNPESSEQQGVDTFGSALLLRESGTATVGGGGMETPEYKELKRILDPKGQVLREVLVEDLGYHLPTRPLRLQYPKTVASMTSHKYPLRHDYLFFGNLQQISSSIDSASPPPAMDDPSVVGGGGILSIGSGNGREEAGGANGIRIRVRTVPGTSKVDKFPAQGTAPYNYLSDHFGIQVQLAVFSQSKGHNVPLDPTAPQLLKVAEEKRREFLEIVANLDFNGRHSSSASSPVPQQRSTRGKMISWWVKVVRSVIKLPIILRFFFESVFLLVVLYCSWVYSWVFYLAAPFLLFYVLRWIFGNQIVDTSESKFGKMSEATRLGLAPLKMNKSSSQLRSAELGLSIEALSSYLSHKFLTPSEIKSNKSHSRKNSSRAGSPLPGTSPGQPSGTSRAAVLRKLNNASPFGTDQHGDDPVNRLFDLWSRSLQRHGWLPCFGGREKNSAPVLHTSASAAEEVGGTSGPMPYSSRPDDVVFNSYRDVDDIVANAAAGMFHHLGLRCGDSVAIMSDPNPSAFLVHMAAVKIGVQSVLVKGDSSTVRKTIDRTKAKNVFVSHSHAMMLLNCRSRVLERVILLGNYDSQEVHDSADEHSVRVLRFSTLCAEGLLHPIKRGDGALEGADSLSLNNTIIKVPYLTEQPQAPSTGGEPDYLSITSISALDLIRWIAVIMDTNLLELTVEERRRAGKKSATKESDNTSSTSSTSSTSRSKSPSKPSSKEGSSMSSYLSYTVQTAGAPFPASGSYLSHQPLSNVFELSMLWASLYYGYRIGFSNEVQSGFFEDCKVFRPTVFMGSQQVFSSLRVQFYNTRRSWSRLTKSMYSWLFGFRAGLMRQFGRDSRTLRRLFFRQFENQLGGRVKRIIIPRTERLSFSVRQFTAVCYCPLVREVTFRPQSGFMCIDGLLPPRVLLKVREADTTRQFTLQPSCGELMVCFAPNSQASQHNDDTPNSSDTSAPQTATILDTQEQEEEEALPQQQWKRSGVVGSWVTSGASNVEPLDILCPANTMLWPHNDFYVVASNLEREIRRASPYVVNIFITCHPGKPLVAIIVPHRESLEEWLRRQGLGGGNGSGGPDSSIEEELQSLPQEVGSLRSWGDLIRVGTPIVFNDLTRIATQKRWHSFEHIRAVHLHPHPFGTHSDFFDVDNALRRPRLAHYFSQHVIQLYDHITETQAAAGINGESTVAAPHTALPPPPRSLQMQRNSSDLSEAGLSSPISWVRRRGSHAEGESSGSESSSSIASYPSNSSMSQRQFPSSVHNLPPHAEPEDIQVPPLAVDIGGTCAKVVYFTLPGGPGTPDFVTKEAPQLGAMFPRHVSCFKGDIDVEGENKNKKGGGGGGIRDNTGVLSFINLPTHKFPKLVDFIAKNNLSAFFKQEHLQNIPATGGGAYKYSGLVEDKLKTSFAQYKEMDCVMRGLNFLISNAPDSIFTYDLARLCPSPAQLPADSAARYPFLLVNIGSGVSIIKCLNADGDHVRVGGSPIGGGTFWGLVKALTNITSWEEVHELTRVDGPGDNTNLDLLVGDIYGFGATNLPLKLSVDTVASTFGKFGTSSYTAATNARAGRPNLASPSPTPNSTSQQQHPGGVGTPVTEHLQSPLSAHGVFPRNPTVESEGAAGGHFDSAALPEDFDAFDFAGGDGEEAGGGRVETLTGPNSGGTHTAASPTSGMSQVAGSFRSAGPGMTAHESSASALPTDGRPTLQPSDVVRSLLIMIANNVTQLAYLLAKVENAPNLFFTGGFVRENPIVWRQITRALGYWSSGQANAHFFQHDGYLGALGALISPVDAKLKEMRTGGTSTTTGGPTTTPSK